MFLFEGARGEPESTSTDYSIKNLQEKVYNLTIKISMLERYLNVHIEEVEKHYELIENFDKSKVK